MSVKTSLETFGVRGRIPHLPLNKQQRSQPDDLVPLCKYFRVHWLWKQSISKEMNIDNNFA
jgi:hypothetical protein